MKHATSRLLFAYWDALRRDRAAPERSEIDPGGIRHILADSFILAAEPSGSATFRLAGTRCSALFGRDLSASLFETLWADIDAGEPLHLVGMVASETVGLVFGSRAVSQEGQELALETVLLPLRHRGRPHTRLLGAMSARSLPDWIGVVPLLHQTVTSTRIIDARTRRNEGANEFVRTRTHSLVVHEGGRIDPPARLQDHGETVLS